MHMKKTLRILLILALVSFSAMVTLADPPGPPTGGNAPPVPGPGSGPVGAPLDGGLSLLLIGLGAAYGGKKLFKAKEVKE